MDMQYFRDIEAIKRTEPRVHSQEVVVTLCGWQSFDANASQCFYEYHCHVVVVLVLMVGLSCFVKCLSIFS